MGNVPPAILTYSRSGRANRGAQNRARHRGFAWRSRGSTADVRIYQVRYHMAHVIENLGNLLSTSLYDTKLWVFSVLTDSTRPVT